MLYIGLHFHAYQPPSQPIDIVEKIFRESYEPVVGLLAKINSSFLSLDIAKSLGERLPHWFIAKIAQLIYDKKIELINTAAYHYLLPLVPDAIALRQLNLNREFYNQRLAGCYQNGVFLPEMAFSQKLIPVVKAAGSLWLIADDYAFSKINGESLPEKRVPQNWIPALDECGVLMRSRLWSNRLSQNPEHGDIFAQELIEDQYRWRKLCNIYGESYVIISTDLETIGHHHKNAVLNFLTPFYKEIGRQKNRCQIVPLDFIFNRFEKRPLPRCFFPPHSWSTDDLNVPFPLWNHPDHQFHNLWNEFARVTFELAPEKPNLELQELLDKAFYSCSPWQYSYGKPEIAAWCLQYFKSIYELLASAELEKIYEKIKYLTNAKN